MSNSFLHIHQLYFSYPSASYPLFDNLSLSFQAGWTAVTGANGSGKTTLLRIIAGELPPGSGSISFSGRTAYCPQEITGMPAEVNDFFNDMYAGDADAGRLFGILEMDWDWTYRWDSLSFGERKKAQIASALYSRPDVLLLDEPTNHLDSRSQDLLQDSLKLYDGIGIAVSHDRLLLDELSSRTLILSAAGHQFYNCGWSESLRQRELEGEHRQKLLAQARKEERRLKTELQRRREEEQRHKKDFSKKGLDPRDSDTRAKIDAARLSGRDAIGGNKVRAMQDRLERLQDANPGGPGKRSLGVSFSSREFRGDLLLALPAGELTLGEKTLNYPDIELPPGFRLALKGHNGSGKSSLIRRLLSAGAVKCDDYLYLPQELTPDETRSILGQFEKLDGKERGEVISHFARLNGSPSVLEESPSLSSGELRKLAISLAFFRESPLLILDEPTNHLDLPSRIALEEALNNYDGALFLVSHDRQFLGTLCRQSWKIDTGRDGQALLCREQ